MRYATAAEFAAIADVDGASFGFTYSEQDVEDARLDVDTDTMLVALDGDRIVGASCEVGFRMTVPGGEVAATGLTWVSVEITHRRRGILRGLVERQLRAGRDSGVPAVILTASEAGIYSRYGFGVATTTRKVVIDRAAATPIRPRADHGVRRISTEAAGNVLPPLYDRWRSSTPGALDRSDRRWRLQLLDRASQRSGRSGLLHLVHAGGYVSYRVMSDGNDGQPRHVCSITDYVISTPDAHAGLWQVLLGMDLCARVESYRIPIDDPLPHLITDPRQVQTTVVNDGLWVRPLDVAALLAARTYAVPFDAVVHVIDPMLGDTTVHLRGDQDGATCQPTAEAADVELGVGDLGMLVLGGRRVGPLADAGRVRADAATLTRLDRAFLADRAPQYGTSF